MLYTRRELVKLAAVAIPAVRGLVDRPNSKVAGVQIGLNVPYDFGGRTMDGDEILRRCLQLGVSAVELRSQPVEEFAGGRPASMDKAAAFRKKYEDAGVRIEIVKFDDVYKQTDPTIDYFFELTRALGAHAMSCEISLDDTKRLGRFADKHQIMVGYHGHTETTPQMWETAFSYARYNGANVDLGHFIAGNNASPIPFISEHHDRVTHVHVKDRKLQNGPNVPFGEGDTPIVETLRLIRDKKWNIQATIEFEYPVPSGSDRMTEIAKCVQYCRKALA
ncbi:MAG TPA: sugar phosphate isomerase/epimerase [Vicinamibacterales bacterium]|nr:sugar phosphate isomerase/epimerase [Vicinamibacterales bacterium]